ncbi:MFS transporter [Kineococcus sp. SYSU DK004]|uniref:MFS transporter n=1 Tax=Kineococcus sp. SYSU DK004 TaxID=3383125 RepID=UPI003D7EED20
MPHRTADDPGRPRLGVLPGFLVLLSPVSQLGFTPVSVVLGDQLGLSTGQVGVTVGVYPAAAALATVVLGPLFDLVPARRVLPVAVAANVVLSASLLLAPGFTGLVVARVLTGFANSALLLCAAVAVADANRGHGTARERGFSRLQTFTSVGAVVGLGVGAAAAGLGQPRLWSWTVVGYGLLVLLLAPAIARRLPPAPATTGTAGTRLRVVLTDAGAALRVPRTALVLAAAGGVGWAIQAAHYAVSLLSEELSPPLWQRVLLSVMIPAGVFAGSLLNQRLLARTGAGTLFARTYPALPVACAVLGLVVGASGAWAAAALLVVLALLGVVLGVLMPLSPAVLVGRHPDLRGSVTAADSVTKGLGSAVSPVVLGAVAAATSLTGGFLVLAAVAGVAAVAARSAAGVRDRDRHRAARRPGASSSRRVGG